MTTLLGLDIGSSSIKAALIDVELGTLVASATSPDSELPIRAVKPGWAEQEPELWWEHVVRACEQLRARDPQAMANVGAIGISYQMHGLVIVDSAHRAIRPSIIWCDSRAVETGEEAFNALGKERTLSHLLNSPGNFTASKMRWVMEHEPSAYGKTHHFMLPGDYIAMKMSGEVVTTPSGLSEGILWDFKADAPAQMLLNHYEIPASLVPKVVPTFSIQGQVTESVAATLGIPAGVPISYRAGDQPNNAFSLKVLEPGEFATTAGTSGVVYGVGDVVSYDPQSRVNTFIHVTHRKGAPRYGTLLCCNGTGILFRWLRDQLAGGVPYHELNSLAASVAPGAEGLVVLPYGNGAERSLGNKVLGGAFQGINFNIHGKSHLLRAAQEGIVFSLQYGLEVMKEMGTAVRTVRAGHANLFLSPLFREVFAAVTGAVVELYDTDGAQGAARGAGFGAGFYSSLDDAFRGLALKERIEPRADLQERYKEIYGTWRGALSKLIA